MHVSCGMRISWLQPSTLTVELVDEGKSAGLEKLSRCFLMFVLVMVCGESRCWYSKVSVICVLEYSHVRCDPVSQRSSEFNNRKLASAP